MKTKPAQLFAQCRYSLCVTLLVLGGLPAHAFRGDETAKPASPASQPKPKTAALRQLSADQLNVAQLAEPAGVKVEWISRLGTPLSIRGPDLGQRRSYSGGKGLALKGGGAYEQDAIAVLDNLSRFYRVRDAAAEFAVRQLDGDSLNFHHVRLRQVYKGLRVFGGDLIVHFDKSGQAYQVNGEYVPDIQVDVVPGIQGDEAVRLAQRDLAAMGKPAGTLQAEATLVIFARDAEPQLAYELVLLYDDPKAGPGRWRYWVDARQGTVLLRYNDIQKISPPTTNGTNAPVTGSILAGEGGQSVSVTSWYENTGYYYLYNTNRVWYVYNRATSGYPDANTYAYRTTPAWGTSDRVEMSGARNFDLVQRYYAEVHGRSSFNNSRAYAQANVHYGTSYVNAYWDGSAFWFGDGDGATANPLGIQDVCGHEFTHAVDQYTADLIYSGESGALNESFSDIMGACIEFWAQPDGRANYPAKVAGTADWLCGEDCWLSSVALRDMRNPANSATVGPGNEQPSRYKGTYWDPLGEVHQNDGVQNFFFYLLCEGGSGNNDGILYSVTGIGVTNAQRVAYRALTVYCTPSTDYQAVRSAWLSAALDLNPGWASSAAAAWSAVGINALLVTPSALTFRGPVGGPFAPTTQTFTLVNRDAVSMNWSVTCSQGWASVSPTNGSLPAGGSSGVSVAINELADGLAMGIYTNLLGFTNTSDPGSQTIPVKLLVGQPDYFTELFDAADNDLDFQAWTFTPDGSSSFYSACRDVATSFPTDPAGGTSVSLSDDSYAQVMLAGTSTVAIYNRRTNVFFIGSNGYLTMGSGDSSLGESFASHFNLPRISACFDDLNPGSGGTVSWKQTNNLVAVTFSNVPEYGSSATVSFQIEMFFDGRIRITYLGVGVTDGLAGLSAGAGVPAGFVESDLTSYSICPPPDDLVVTPTTGLASQGYQGGPFTPASTTYTLSNIGTDALTWSAAAAQPWLSLSVTNGTLAPAANTNIGVAINTQANSLAPGLYADTLTLRNLGTGFTQTRSVSLRVLAIPGEIAVSDSIPPAADLQMPFGDVIVGASRTEHITVTNTDATYGVVINNISFGAYVENFDDGLAQNWVPDIDANWQVVSGEYRAQASATEFMTSRYSGQEWTDLTAQMTCRRSGTADNSASLALRATADFDDGVGSGYVFQITTSGQYSIWKQVNGTWSWLQSWTTSSAILTGTNVLTATAQGSDLRFYINGTLVWSGTDTALVSGRVGLMGYTEIGYLTTHYFDNVIVSDVQSGGVVSAQQQWFNQHALAAGSRGLAPAAAPPPYPGEADPPAPGGSPVFALSLTSGPWRLDNVPTMPYTVPPHGALTFDVAYQPTTTASNQAKVVIDSNDADEPRVEVQLTGQGILDYLGVTPAPDFASQGHPGGPFAPPSTSYVLSNAGPIAVGWATVHTQAWVSVLPPNGTLAPGEAATVTVGLTAAANSLSVGTYYDRVIFTNLTTTVAQRRAVILRVFTSPQIVVSPASMSVTNALGGSTNQVLTVSNALTADGSLTFNISTRETGRSPLLLAAAGVGLPPLDHDFTKAGPGENFVPDRLLVRFAAAVSAGQRAQILNALGGAQVIRDYQIVPGLCLVKLGAGQTLPQALQSFNQTSGILYAEPDYVLKAIATTPNDPRFSELWGMHNTGQTGGTPDADIDAPEAWDFNTGSRSVIVAVIDTGADYTHLDLTNNIWTNPGEIPGNGIDDDGNGYVDDVHGYDFVNNDGDPKDDNGHGTHVSGTIGAQGNNGVGVAGVCWQVRIMPVKFLDAGGSGSTADAVSCIQYATLMGARVMNNSWGGGAYEQSLKDAIDAAGAAGIVFVAAAGNDAVNNDTTPHYPSSYTSSNIVAVMSTDHNDLRSSFSCYGLTSVDLGAPGTSILSCQPGGGYQVLSGTSMATPHVSGACALLLAANPMLRVADLKQALFSTVDPTLLGQCVSGGRLNLARALTSVGAAWITVTPAGATNLAPGAAINVNVAFQAGDLAAGTYSGELVVAGNDVVNPTVTVPVTMTILPDDLQITPSTAFASSGVRGGPFTPSEFAYTLSNRSPASLSWEVVHTQSWVSVSATGGTLPAGASLVLTAAVNSAASLLVPGQYADTLLLSNLTSGAAQRRAVTLEVQPPPPTTICSFPLDTNPGWSTQGQWQFGRPLGSGSHNYDPTAGHTGTNVFGYNLAGDYPNYLSTTYYLTTTALDCSGYEHVRLVFWRWLGVESASYDHADIEVSTNGVTWVHVWDHTGSSIADTAWQQVSYDISAVADRRPAVYIRWGMGPTDGSVTYPGWNIDDISLTGNLLDPLTVNPGDGLVSQGYSGGPFSPDSKSYTLVNAGSSNLDWTASSPTSWVTVAPSGGSLAAGASTNAVVMLNTTAQSLSNGVFTGAVTFSNLLSSATQTRTVQLTVVERPPPPSAPCCPIPTNNATGVSVHTLLTWNTGQSNLYRANPWSGALPSAAPCPNPDPAQGFAYRDGMLVAADLAAQAPSVPRSDTTSGALPLSTTLINFDNVTSPCAFGSTGPLRDAYSALGVTFEGPSSLDGGAILNECGGFSVTGYSSPNFLAFNSSVSMTNGGLARGPETLRFSSPVSRVAALVGSGSWAGTSLTMQAFNAGGTLVNSASVVLASAVQPITVSGSGIVRVVVSTSAAVFVLDDLSFDSATSSADRYDVYLGTNPSALSLIASNLSQTTCNPGLLAFNTNYFWQVVASNVSGVATGAVWTFTTAADEVLFASAAQSVSENAGAALITVLRENPAGGPISVHYATTNGSATAGSDYTAVSGTLDFPAGVMSTNFSVPILDDTLTEYDETVLLSLTQVTPNVVLGSNAVLTIVDNDGQLVSLPYYLYDSYPYQWDIYYNGSITDGTSDAYDGGHVLSGFPSFSTGFLFGGREVVLGPTNQGGLDISRRIYVPTNHAYARFLEVLHNPGGSPITTTVRLDSNLGSDSSTVLVGTSSGDTVFGTDDNWIVTDDADGSGDPTVLHVIANNSGAIRPSAVSYSTGLLGYQYSVTVPPGETRMVMHFGAQNPNRATALAKAPELTALGQDALAQVAPEDWPRILNFGLPDVLQVSPVDGLVSSGYRGGPFTPSNKVYSVINSGGSNVTWSAGCPATWVSVTPSTGSLAPGATTNVTVLINANAQTLTNGTFAATVTWSNLLSGATQARAVQLNIAEPPQPPSPPCCPMPTNYATGVSVHTRLSWNNPANLAPGLEPAGSGLPVSAQSVTNILVVGFSTTNINTVASGLGATVTTTTNFAAASLLDVNLVIFYAGSSTYFTPDAATRTKLSNFVATGGGLYVELGGAYPALSYAWVPSTGITSTAGNSPSSDNVTIAVPLHVIAAGVTDAGLDNWGYSSHGDFTAYGGLDLVFLDANTGLPVTLAGSVGSGKVVYSNLDPTYNHSSISRPTELLVLSNACRFAISGSGAASYNVYFATNPSALSLIASNLTQTSCDPGLLAFNTTYFWQVVASNVSGAATGAVWTFTTALDEVRFASATSSIAENGGAALITLLRENPVGGAVSVHYASTNGTATAGSDYTAVSGTLDFPAGVMSNSFLVPILDDTLPENNETVLLSLSPVTPNVALGSNAVLTITDNDRPMVAVFDDPLYVDTTSGGTSAESDNVQASLTNLGCAVATFALTNLTQAAASYQRLLFPELENGDLALALTAAQRAALSNGVVQGGTLIVHGNYYGRAGNLLRSVLGWSVVETNTSGGTHYRTAAANGTQFTNAPASLTDNNATTMLQSGSLPLGARSIYTNAIGSAVVAAPCGSGLVVFLGWDWYNGFPIGTQDGGWLAALRAAVLQGSLPPPDALQVSPADGLVSSGYRGGPFTPSSKVYAVTNVSGSNLTWSAGCTAAWVSVTPSTGSLAASATTNVTVLINANAQTLTNGTFAATVTWSNLLSGATQARAVQLTVTEPPQPPSPPCCPTPTNYATGVSVHTLLSWNNTGAGAGTLGSHGAYGVIDTTGYDADALTHIQGLAGLTATSVPWSMILSSSGANLLAAYDVIYFSVDPGSTDYQNLTTAVTPGNSLDQFVSLGGTLVLNLAGNNGSQVNIGPGGLGYDRNTTHDAAIIAAPGHPYATGAGYGGTPLTATMFNSWYSTDHGTLTGLPASATELLRNADGTSMIEYSWGAGRVIASTLTFGWTGSTIRFGPPFDNELLYAASGLGLAGTGYTVYFGTNPASLSLIATNLPQTTCTPGLLAFNTSYFWQVVASNAVGCATGAVWTFTTALDEVRFASANSSVAENAGAALITLLRENPAGGAVSIHYAATNGTATAGSDYTAVSGTLDFPAGVMSNSFAVPILDDTVPENYETVLLSLSQATPNVFLGSNAVLTITDNDQPCLDFQITGMFTNNSRVVDHDSLTGDDRGGIAVSSSQVFITGDYATARFNAADLTAGTGLGRMIDSLCADLRTETVYALGNGSTALTSAGGTVTTLIELNGATGQPTGALLPLSQSFTMPSSGNGIFSGYGRVVVHNGTRVYDILLPLGTVIDRGTMTIPNWSYSESWSVWGVAEYFGGALYLAYAANLYPVTTIERARVPDGLTSTVATFSNLSDMASFTASLSRSRWYFHYEGSGQFGGTSETLGYADAQFSFCSTNPPVIIAHPLSQTVRPGANVTFCVNAIGAETCQWRKNGTNLLNGGRFAGATNACLTISSVVEPDSGQYSVALTNAHGWTISSNATLLVTPLDHFAWDAIPSPQCTNSSITVTIRAQDAVGSPVANFTGSVALTGWVGGARATNTILASPAYSSSSSGTFTLGYAFTPNTNLTVTHVRHYFGSKVSIWTDAGTLLAAQNVTSIPGTWVETPLASPIQLTNGATYRVASYSAGGNYYWRYDLASTFPYGTIDQSYEASGDTFPGSSDSVRWWFVDLRYTVGSALPVPVIPPVSGNFTAGLWSGTVCVPQPATNMVLRADDGQGHSGSSASFTVSPCAVTGLSIALSGSSQVQLSFLTISGTNYVVEFKNVLTDPAWVPYQTNIGDGSIQIVTCIMAGPQRFFRVRLQ